MMKLVVLSCVVAMASAGGFIAPLAYSAPFAYASPAFYAAPLLTPSNYRGPLSLAPGQPANILAADGRPLDTLDVNLDRSAHYTAKALEGAHVLKKRSAPLFAYSSPAITTYSAPAITSYSTPALTTYSSPAFTSYVAPSPYVHLIKKRSAPLIAAAPALYSSAITYSSPAFTTYAAPAPFAYARTPYVQYIKK